MIYSLKLFLKNIWYAPSRFFRRLWRVIQYIPVTWRNDDYDGGFVLDILIYKISRQRKRWQKMLTHSDRYICHEGMDNGIKWMLIVEKLLTRWNDEYYESEDYPELGEMLWLDTDNPEIKQLEFKISDNDKAKNVLLLNAYIAKYPNDHRKTLNWMMKYVPDGELTQERVTMYMRYMRNKRALQIALDIMKNQLPAWWD